MNPPADMSTEVWLQKCIEKAEAAPVDAQARGTLLFAMSILGGLVHEPTFFQKLIPELKYYEKCVILYQRVTL